MAKITSVKKQFRLYFRIILLLLLATTLAYGSYSVRSFSKKTIDHNAVSLEKYTASFSEDLSTLETFSRQLVYSDPSFRLLSLYNIPDVQRVPEQYYLRKIIQSHTPSYGAILLYDSVKDDAFFILGNQLSQDQAHRAEIHSYLHNLGDTPENYGLDSFNQWFVSWGNGNPWLILANRQNRITIFSCINLNAYLARYPVPVYSDQSSIVLFSSDQILIGDIFMEKNLPGIDALLIPRSSLWDIFRTGHFHCTTFLAEYQTGISVVTPVSALITHMLPQIAYMLLIIALVTVIVVIAYHSLRQLLIYPLQEIAAMSRQSDDPSAPAEPAILPSRHYQEYSDIKNALLALRDHIITLQNERNKKEQAREHALLQYFQLQTRSHFFLNCLKSLYSMLENEEHVRMKNMILSFSSHLRYVFHDTLSLVSLEDEQKETNDYHRIISMDSSILLILEEEIPSELLSYQVPPLTIQTFLENSYQYSGTKDAPLLFTVQAQTVPYHDRMYLQIRCSDNGRGYDPSVLEKINGEVDDDFDQYHVGINNLKRRMAILYKNDFHMAFYNQPGGGACSVIYVPATERKELL